MTAATTLDGKVALVTGASRGIGRGIALALADAGAVVYVTGRSAPGETARGTDAPRDRRATGARSARRGIDRTPPAAARRRRPPSSRRWSATGARGTSRWPRRCASGSPRCTKRPRPRKPQGGAGRIDSGQRLAGPREYCSPSVVITDNERDERRGERGRDRADGAGDRVLRRGRLVLEKFRSRVRRSRAERARRRYEDLESKRAAIRERLRSSGESIWLSSSRRIKCEKCDGRGYYAEGGERPRSLFENWWRCTSCGGSGRKK